MENYKIILDKERTLIYSNRSFHELEKHTGKPILSIMAELAAVTDGVEQQQKMMDRFFSARFLTSFIWAGLLHEKMSYESVIDIVSPKKYMEIMQFAMNVILSEFGLSGGEINEEEKKKEEEITGTGGMPS